MDRIVGYLNFVQIPNMPKFTDEQKPVITKIIAPAVCFILGGNSNNSNWFNCGLFKWMCYDAMSTELKRKILQLVLECGLE